MRTSHNPRNYEKCLGYCQVANTDIDMYKGTQASPNNLSQVFCQ